MKCYGQIIHESGSYANPFPDDYSQWDSIGAAKDVLAGCWNDLDVEPTQGQGVSLLLWIGEPEPEALYPCDDIPDRMFELGPRYGVRSVSC